MTVNISTISRNAACNAILDLINAGTAQANGYLEIRTGSKPANPQAIASGTLLATLIFSDPAFGDAVNGTASANSITSDTTIDATGIASWFRVYNRDNQAIFDGDVTELGGGGDLEFDNINFVVNGTCQILAFTATMPQ